MEAWRAGLPYAELIFHLLQSELELITGGKKLTHIHANLSTWDLHEHYLNYAVRMKTLFEQSLIQ